MLGSAVQRSELAKCTHIFPPSWTFLPSPSTHLGHHRAPSWAPYNTTRLINCTPIQNKIFLIKKQLKVLMSVLETLNALESSHFICQVGKNKHVPIHTHHTHTHTHTRLGKNKWQSWTGTGTYSFSLFIPDTMKSLEEVRVALASRAVRSSQGWLCFFHPINSTAE